MNKGTRSASSISLDQILDTQETKTLQLDHAGDEKANTATRRRKIREKVLLCD